MRAAPQSSAALLAERKKERAELAEDLPYSGIINDYDLAKRCTEVLDRRYPGHLWAVTVNQGVIIIHNMALSAEYGYAIHSRDLDTEYRHVIRAGGEILERFNMARSRLREDELFNINRDFAQRPIGDLK